MITVNAIKDIPNKIITFDTVFDAPRQAVWDAWTDGEKLARWWGPEGWPATNVSHDFREGGHWHYRMTSDEDGTEAYGWIDYLDIIPIDSFTGRDAFADKDGNKNTDLPSATWTVSFEDQSDGKTHLTTKLVTDSSEDAQKLIDMGMTEGYTMSLQNLERLLAKESA